MMYKKYFFGKWLKWELIVLIIEGKNDTVSTSIIK